MNNDQLTNTIMETRIKFIRLAVSVRAKNSNEMLNTAMLNDWRDYDIASDYKYGNAIRVYMWLCVCACIALACYIVWINDSQFYSLIDWNRRLASNQNSNISISASSSIVTQINHSHTRFKITAIIYHFLWCVIQTKTTATFNRINLHDTTVWFERSFYFVFVQFIAEFWHVHSNDLNSLSKWI